jgi:phosphoribosyl-AMP cyclohydrolase
MHNPVEIPAPIREALAKGLIAAIAQDAKSNEVLMIAWMNEEALTKTLESKRATYFSRSRSQLWVKGETSGHFQEVVDIKFDCDGDAVLMKVNQTGAACHTGEYSCFHNEIK